MKKVVMKIVSCKDYIIYREDRDITHGNYAMSINKRTHKVIELEDVPCVEVSHKLRGSNITVLASSGNTIHL